MPDFKLRAPDNSNFPGEVFVAGSAGERARLLAVGYTDVTDEPAAEPVDAPPPAGQDAVKPPAEKTATAKNTPKAAPGTETRQPTT